MKFNLSVFLTKITSRKLWLAIAGFVSGMLISANADSNIVANVSGLILQFGSIVIYMLQESAIDIETIAAQKRQGTISCLHTRGIIPKASIFVTGTAPLITPTKFDLNYFLTKLASRKFWIAIAGFVSGIILTSCKDSSIATIVSGFILQFGSIAVYILNEGMCDVEVIHACNIEDDYDYDEDEID